jgi:hypothetical protein
MSTNFGHALDDFIVLSFVVRNLLHHLIIFQIAFLVIQVIILILFHLTFLSYWFILILFHFRIDSLKSCSVIDPLLLEYSHLVGFLEQGLCHLVLQFVLEVLFVFGWSVFHLRLDLFEFCHGVGFELLTHQVLEIFHGYFRLCFFAQA